MPLCCNLSQTNKQTSSRSISSSSSSSSMLNSATTYTPTATGPTTTTTTTTSLDLATDGHLTEQTDVKTRQTRVVRLIRDIERTAVWQLGEREDIAEQDGRQSLSASLPFAQMSFPRCLELI